MISPETPKLTDAELAELPVFPLPNAVLFPGVSMGLHLFEPRYRAMMRHCLEKGPRAIAIAHLQPGFEKDYERQPAIFEIAGAGRIVSHRGNPDGTFDLILEGTQRVRLHELPFVPPFRRARAETLVEVTTDDASLKRVMGALGITEERIERMTRASSVPIAPASAGGSAARMIDLMVEQLVRDQAERQRFLETTDVERRMLMLAELMRSGGDAARRRAMN